MGLVNGIVRLGVAAGAVYAAMKVSDKYKENNPEGVTDTVEKITAIKQAASEVYAEVAGIVKDNAPAVKNSVNSTVQRASDFASEKMPGAAEKVQEFVEKVAEKAPDIAEKVQTVVENVADKVATYADAVAAPVKSAEEQFDEVVDAEFEPVEDENKEE